MGESSRNWKSRRGPNWKEQTTRCKRGTVLPNIPFVDEISENDDEKVWTDIRSPVLEI